MFPSVASASRSSSPSSPRAFERRVWHFRWLVACVGVPLSLILEAAPLWVSLAGFGGLALHNGFRWWLVHRASDARLRALSHVVFALDAAVFFVALWPLLRDGMYPVQLLPLVLLLEAASRYRDQSPAIAIAAITLALIAFELLGLRHHETPRRVVLWSCFYAACGIGAAAAVRHRQPPVVLAPPQPPEMALATPPDRPQPSLPPPTGKLTRQQHIVLRHLAHGLTRREIADAMHLDIETVHSHVRGAYRNLGASGRADALVRARIRGVLDAPDDMAAG